MDSLIRNRYKLVEQFRNKPGRQTWLAFDTEKDQQVVLKKLCFDASFGWDALKQFERESKILKNLDHPKVPKLLDSFELDGENGSEFILIQSYIEARSLTEHVQAGRTFTDVDIEQIAESVLDTLSYLHGRCPPVIHRDIKPSNILLGDRSGNRVGQVYLVDFGSVQTPIATGTDTFTIVGSYGYMAPEQFIGRAAPASDLYGLGATLIYLATGRHPADLMTDDPNLDWREHISLSPHLTDWVKQLAEPDLSRRFKTVEEAVKHLKNPSTISKNNSSEAAFILSDQYPLASWNGLPLRYLISKFSLVVTCTALLLVVSSNIILSLLHDLPIPLWVFLIYFIQILAIAGDLTFRFLRPNSHGYYSAAWMKWGDQLRDAGNKQEALAKYNRAVEIRPQNHSAWYRIGKVLDKLDRYEEALFSYEKAIQLRPNHLFSWTNRGHALNNLERYEEAIDSFDRAIKLKSDHSWAWNNRGYALGELKRYEEALDSFDRAIELKPDYSGAWSNRGCTLAALKRRKEAIDSHDRAIKLKPNSSWAWGKQGYALDELEMYEEAIGSYDRAIKLKPSYSWAWGKRGYVLTELKKYEEAIDSYDRVIELEPDDSWAWGSRGYALGELKRYEEALDSFDRAIELKPDYSWAWGSRGYAFKGLKRYEEAIDDFDRAIELDPEYSRAWHGRGSALNLLKRYKEAIDSFDRSIELESAYFWTWSNRGYSLKAKEIGRYEEALASFDTALKLNPDCHSARQGRSQVLRLLNRDQ